LEFSVLICSYKCILRRLGGKSVVLIKKKKCTPPYSQHPYLTLNPHYSQSHLALNHLTLSSLQP
jgi:hypothetical protein